MQFAINILYRNYMFMYYTLCYKKYEKLYQTVPSFFLYKLLMIAVYL